jgi:hypothetical protein
MTRLCDVQVERCYYVPDFTILVEVTGMKYHTCRWHVGHLVDSALSHYEGVHITKYEEIPA